MAPYVGVGPQMPPRGAGAAWWASAAGGSSWKAPAGRHFCATSSLVRKSAPAPSLGQASVLAGVGRVSRVSKVRPGPLRRAHVYARQRHRGTVESLAGFSIGAGSHRRRRWSLEKIPPTRVPVLNAGPDPGSPPTHPHPPSSPAPHPRSPAGGTGRGRAVNAVSADARTPITAGDRRRGGRIGGMPAAWRRARPERVRLTS